MASPPHATPLSGQFHRAPPCHPPPSHFPEHARHLGRPRRASQWPERNVPVTRPDVPGRAQTRTGACQSMTSPRQLRPRLAISARQQLRHDTRRRPDTPVGPRERCSRRHRRRFSPRHCKLPSSSRPRHCLFFPAIKRNVTAVTSPTSSRQRPSHAAPVDASSWLTSPPSHGLTSLL